jgi:hypothetical protein
LATMGIQHCSVSSEMGQVSLEWLALLSFIAGSLSLLHSV